MPDQTNFAEQGASLAALEPTPLADVVVSEIAAHRCRLDWVGMSAIAVQMAVELEGELHRITGEADAFVSLEDPDSRGIHMSRLYLLSQECLRAPLSPASLSDLLAQFAASHLGISKNCLFEVRFDLGVFRPALLSVNQGYRSYPVTVKALLNEGQLTHELGFTVTYSSTCPCSAALARQLNQEQFLRDFSASETELLKSSEVFTWLGSERAQNGVPHAQRSTAEIRVRLNAEVNKFDWLYWINLVEAALTTPVQAAVKREDEQEFARLNARNTMFCEDAARRLHRALANHSQTLGFWAKVTHLESLHAHNAVSIVSHRSK